MSDNQNTTNCTPAARLIPRNWTYTLKEDTDGKFRFVLTLQTKFAVCIELLLTVLLLTTFLWWILADIDKKSEFIFLLNIFIILIILFFFSVIKIINGIFTSNIFDPENNLYHRVKRFTFNPQKEIKEKISSINAIQILPVKIFPYKSFPHTVYELNLLFESGNKRNVVCYKSYKNIKSDACKLAGRFGLSIIECELVDQTRFRF